MDTATTTNVEERNMWDYIVYASEHKIQRHVLSPNCGGLMGARLGYISERYGCTPETHKQLPQIHIDLGGMCFVNEPEVIVGLSDGRRVSVLKYQALSIARILRDKCPETIGDAQHVRMQSFPGLLVFLSLSDRDELIEGLELGQRDELAAGRHKKQMQSALDKANADASARWR
jgi:hypothetical protein